MGKLKGIVKFTGHFEGLSFFESGGKIIVRKTGGFEGKAIKTQDNYIRTRENASEFGHCATMGKLFRQGLSGYLMKVRRLHLHGRVTGLMTAIMQCDGQSERGKRQVGLGATTLAGQLLLQKFKFDPASKFAEVLGGGSRTSIRAGQVHFETSIGDAVFFPEGATHLSLRLVTMRADFGQGSFMLSEGEIVKMSRNEIHENLHLSAGIPVGNGLVLGLVFGSFSQELHGISYDLECCFLEMVFVKAILDNLVLSDLFSEGNHHKKDEDKDDN